MVINLDSTSSPSETVRRCPFAVSQPKSHGKSTTGIFVSHGIERMNQPDSQMPNCNQRFGDRAFIDLSANEKQVCFRPQTPTLEQARTFSPSEPNIVEASGIFGSASTCVDLNLAGTCSKLDACLGTLVEPSSHPTNLLIFRNKDTLNSAKIYCIGWVAEFPGLVHDNRNENIHTDIMTLKPTCIHTDIISITS